MEKLCNTFMKYDIEKGTMPKNVMILITWSFLYRPKYGYSETFDTFHTRKTTRMVVPAKLFDCHYSRFKAILSLCERLWKFPKFRKTTWIRSFNFHFTTQDVILLTFGSIIGCEIWNRHRLKSSRNRYQSWLLDNFRYTRRNKNGRVVTIGPDALRYLSCLFQKFSRDLEKR
jgi:hypothetical protein